MKIFDLRKQMGEFSLRIDRMDLEPGAVHGLVGANGSGKSTLSKLIMGILTPDSGRIDYEGLSPRDITMTSQKPYLLHDTVYQNLIYPWKIRGIRPDEEAADRLLARCGLGDKKQQYARSLSSGEQQKLSFIRALIFHPSFIIVDETLSNLDPDSTELFEEMIREQQRTRPVTWLIISHQLIHIKRLCSRIHFLEKGRQIAQGSPEEILLHPEHPAIRRFLANTEVFFHESQESGWQSEDSL